MRNAIKPTRATQEAVIWAIDPSEEETRPDRAVIRQLMSWVRSSNLALQPVHILALPKDDECLEGAGVDRYIATGEKNAEKYLKDLDIVGAQPVKIILAGSSSRQQEVEDLLEYAGELNSKCIVVSSHGRSGVQRLVLGSFAETLLRRSVYPVMFLTHIKTRGQAHQEFESALFATDFSDRSREAFLRFLPEAKRSHLKLTLFHSVALPVAAVSVGYAAPMPDDYFSTQTKWAKHEASRWVKLAESHGVHVRIVVEEDGIGPNIADKVLSVAQEEGAGLVVMASASGAAMSLLMGSVAREVFRSNRYPVWIYGPRALEKRQAA